MNDEEVIKRDFQMMALEGEVGRLKRENQRLKRELARLRVKRITVI